ncbi:MAG: hypothetical protein JNK25_02390 [Phycisphaerae bacterium]|nr:hypothetical protein [Phycisphaerae bacterium]
MASCKSGKPGTIVSPAEPLEAAEADNADPVEVNKLKVFQRELKEGKYGKQLINTFKPEEAKKGKTEELTWIDLKMKDGDKPNAGEPFEVKLPNGEIATGTLDEKGEATVRNIPKGKCEVFWPRLHEKKWKKS